MRILMLNYEYPPLGGGASPVTRDLSLCLSENGHAVDVVTMGYKGLPAEEKEKKVNVYRVPCFRKKIESSGSVEMLTYVISGYIRARSLMNKNRYDAIHAHFIIPTGIFAICLKREFKKRLIITSHGSDVPGYNPDRFKFQHKMLARLWKKIAGNADIITTPSKHLKELILKKERNAHVRVIPNGINSVSGRTEKKEKIILYAGRLFERKGIQYLIEAVSGIPKEWKLVIAGEGYYRKELERLAEKGNAKIEFTGWLNKEMLHKLYSKSSIFVLPSSEESFGMSLAEAMAFSNAVIAIRGTACEEVIGDSGLLVEKKSAESIKKAILKLIEGPTLRKYQTLAKKRAERFLWKNIIKDYLNLYESK